MPVRYTCHLKAVRTVSGKFRVEYRPLMDPGHLFTFVGPKLLVPPDREMTKDELNLWLLETNTVGGFAIGGTRTPGSAALVEAHRTIEDEIPKGSVAWRLAWADDPETGTPTLAVHVENGWDRDIPTFSLAPSYRYDAPQPEGPPDLGMRMLGGWGPTDFRPFDSVPPGFSLMPGDAAGYALRPGRLPSLKSMAASLSPESHWIALMTEGHEFDRIPGAAVADFLEATPQPEPE